MPTGNLHRAKSFLGTPELLSTYKTFIHSLMEYCSRFSAGVLASHSVQLGAMETKAFKTIGISCDEAESLRPSLSHCRQSGGLCVLPPPFWSCTRCSFMLCPPPPHLIQHGTHGAPSSPFWRKTAVHQHLISFPIQNHDLFSPQ